MIISASRRTDLPAFYSEWFIRRIRAGSFISVNPFNPGQRKTVRLDPDNVATLVFWSKNPAPLFKYLPELDERGYRYYFQFTLNDYPRFLEPRVPELTARIAVFQRLAARIGPERVIWRYDPIVISNLTPAAYHVEHFGKLAETLRGYSRRVMISFLDQYDKVKRRWRAPTEGSVAAPGEWQVSEIRAAENQEEFFALVAQISRLAQQNGLEIYSCAEKADLDGFGIHHGSCIDGSLLNRLFNLNIPLTKDRSQRHECGCVSSIDMGVYNTCRFTCSYCYANGDERAVLRNAACHHPESPVMLDW